MNVKRIVFLDVSRALCVMWIVCFWHMNQYLDADTKFFTSGSGEQVFLRSVTNGVLALFTLLSGFFISQKEISCKEDIISFYKKRLVRFFIPLLISCILLTFVGYFSPIQIFTTCLGISQFLPLPYPKTLWYFSMIICFYLISPIMLWFKGKGLAYCISSCLLFFLFFMLGNHFFDFDRRLADNYPFFALPFVFQNSRSILKVFDNKRHYAFLIFAIFIVAYINHTSDYLLQVAMSFAVCFIILSFSKDIAKLTFLQKLFIIVSYLSMFAYLYHREIYILSSKLIGKFDVLEVALNIVLLLFISYFGQKLYDKLLLKLL